MTGLGSATEPSRVGRLQVAGRDPRSPRGADRSGATGAAPGGADLQRVRTELSADRPPAAARAAARVVRQGTWCAMAAARMWLAVGAGPAAPGGVDDQLHLALGDELDRVGGHALLPHLGHQRVDRSRPRSRR